MNAGDLLRQVYKETDNRAYFVRVNVLEQSASLLKVRLYIVSNLFVQIYRNDMFDTTNYVLIYNGQRIFAHDQLGGIWHRHTAANPHLHDTSAEGSQPVTLFEFLDKVESVLAAMDLP